MSEDSLDIATCKAFSEIPDDSIYRRNIDRAYEMYTLFGDYHEFLDKVHHQVKLFLKSKSKINRNKYVRRIKNI